MRTRRRSAVRLVLAACAAVFLCSLLWVSTYALVPVRLTSLMAWRALQGQTVQREWVPIEAMSPHLVTAVIAAEDTKFCAHAGFDMEEMRKAVQEVKAGGRLRGASTISQQTAKNAFLWPGRGYLRKGTEAYFTVLQEAAWSKRRVMEVYLNVAEWGDGLFGAEAAARARFGKPATDLTPQEAALLAAALPNPARWRVDPPGPYVRKRAATLRARARTVRAQGLDACVLNPRGEN